ncbi:acyltransferase family protein [Lactobacillus sp. LL6]|uniref:acyltransferase family protein n=1 Tax=Lactobacillus sp. LL6 TaxID=2596827 RepID=UPI00118661BA|nr:acyltransferase family protein [Lactobacillus sp. LL6]TSO26767.1 acetyltransferase [Lactobacillus sp. LL6]
MQESKMIQGLGGLRGIAIIAIFFYHLYPEIFKGGFIGVSIFFIMSGFLIYITTMRKLDQNVGKFYWQRIQRIYPSLLILLIVCTIFFVTFMPTGIQHIFSEGVSTIGSYNNWYQIFENKSYFAKMTSGSPFTHLWYLSVQMQFYLLWPLIFFIHKTLIEKESVSAGSWFLVGGIILSAALMFVMYKPGSDPSRVYYGTDTRLFSFLIGNLLGALYLQNGAVRIKNQKNIFSFLGILILIAFFLVDGNKGYIYQGGMLIIDVIIATFLWIVINSEKKVPILNNSILELIGSYSFEIYLVHYPIIFFFYNKTRKIDLLLCLLIIILTNAFAFLLKTVTKQGVLILKMKLKYLLSLAVIAILALACGQYMVNRSPEVQQQNNLKASLENNQKSLKHDKKKKEAYSLKKEAVTLIGDSVSLGAAPELKEKFNEIDIDSKEGRQVVQTQSIIENLKKENKLHKLVVLALGTNGPFTKEVGQKLINTIGKNRQIFWVNSYGTHLQWQDQVNEVITQLAEENKNVHVINWAAVASKNQDKLYSDGIHLKPEAQTEYADLIKESIGE